MTPCRISLLLLASVLAPAWGAPVTTVTIRPPARGPAQGAPVTFGQAFRRGDIRRGVRVGIPGSAAQVDVKRLHEDGSVRFAVISAILPELSGNLAVAVSDGAGDPLAKPVPVRVADLLASDFDAVVALKFPDGVERSASARQLLESAGEKARTWLAGPVVSEWLLDGELTGSDGKPDPDLRVQFHVRAYAGCKPVRVCVVVENCLDTWAGNIGYDVQVKLGRDAKLAYEKKAVDHRRLSRWRKDFWWPKAPPLVQVVPDLAYLSASGALPNYDRSVKIPEKTLARLGEDWAKSPETDIMGSGSLTKYMPTTGGRAEIGPYPMWTVQYLLSMDHRARAIVLGNGDLAGSWPIHVRSSKTGRIMTIDERPKFWLNGYQGNERPLWQPDRKAPPSQRSADGKAHPYYLSPDVAHMGSFAYVPYLLTGDYYYLEEAYFWASYTLLAQWQVPRQESRGIMADQIRGNAWGLRNIADASFIAAEGDPEAKYFAEKIHNNMAHLTAKMYGPPEHSKLGFWGERTVQDARIQNPANPQWMITAPWEHDYLIWSLHHLAELGYADAAKPRDYELRWRVGAFLHAGDFDPLMAAPYRMVVGELGPDKSIAFYEDWKKLGEENAKLMSGKPVKLGYDYSAYLALVCAVDAKFPAAPDALKVLLEKTGGFNGMLAEPTWRIVPR